MNNKRTLKPAVYTCPLMAAHFIGHNYGVEKFCKETFQRPAVVYNKLNPDNDSNHLYLQDAILLTEKANDNAILEAWAHQRGGVFVKLPEHVSCDEELSDQVMLVTERMGSVMGEIRKAREDGNIDNEEFENITAQIMKAVEEALALNALVAGQVRELQPAHTHRVITKG